MAGVRLDFTEHPILKRCFIAAAANFLIALALFVGGRSTIPTATHSYAMYGKGGRNPAYYRPVVARYMWGSGVFFFGAGFVAGIIARRH